MYNLAFNIADRQISIFFRQSKKARRLILKNIMPKGFELVVPYGATLEVAKTFFKENFEWVCKEAKKNLSFSQKLSECEKVNILGCEYTLERNNSIRGIISLENDTFTIPTGEELGSSKLRLFLHKQLRNYIELTATEYASCLGTKFNKIRIASQATRWGSCSSNKVLSFNIHLIFAPLEILNYVIAHEVSHLLEMNHSTRFWTLVSKIMPNYQTHRKWLKINGRELKKIEL